MENTMVTIIKYLQDNSYAALGLAGPEDVLTTSRPARDMPALSVTVTPLRTMPAGGPGPAGLWVVAGTRAEQFLTVLELECRHRGDAAAGDVYWNIARRLRDAVETLLAGPTKAGLGMDRKDWTDPEEPVVAGRIRFEYQSDEALDDPERPAVRSWYLTYEVRWWRPIPEGE